MSTNELKYNLTIYNDKLDKDNFDLIYYNKKLWLGNAGSSLSSLEF